MSIDSKNSVKELWNTLAIECSEISSFDYLDILVPENSFKDEFIPLPYGGNDFHGSECGFDNNNFQSEQDV